MRNPRIAMKSSPRSPQLQKACTQQWRPNTAKNKFKKKSWELVSGNVTHLMSTYYVTGAYQCWGCREGTSHTQTWFRVIQQRNCTCKGPGVGVGLMSSGGRGPPTWLAPEERCVVGAEAGRRRTGAWVYPDCNGKPRRPWAGQQCARSPLELYIWEVEVRLLTGQVGDSPRLGFCLETMTGVEEEARSDHSGQLWTPRRGGK